jgi:hypothetical protein
MSQGFCRTAYDLLVEVAQCPADTIPPFNVSTDCLTVPAETTSYEQVLILQRATSFYLQADAFRSVIDEINLQHEQLTEVFK